MFEQAVWGNGADVARLTIEHDSTLTSRSVQMGPNRCADIDGSSRVDAGVVLNRISAFRSVEISSQPAVSDVEWF